jgi:hypothetical protein
VTIDKNMRKINSKFPLMIRAYILLNRMLFITFGGVNIDSTGVIVLNKYLKYCGYFSFTIFTTANFFGFIYFALSEEMAIIYKSDSKILYYMICLITITKQLHMTANLWYLNRNGFRFFQIFSRHKMSNKKNKFFLSMLWICHILMPIVLVVYNSMASDLVKTSNFLFVFLYHLFHSYGFIAVWAVSFLTWITSLHFYELLTDINQDLTRDLAQNSCNFNFKNFDNNLNSNRK